MLMDSVFAVISIVLSTQPAPPALGDLAPAPAQARARPVFAAALSGVSADTLAAAGLSDQEGRAVFAALQSSEAASRSDPWNAPSAQVAAQQFATSRAELRTMVLNAVAGPRRAIVRRLLIAQSAGLDPTHGAVPLTPKSRQRLVQALGAESRALRMGRPVPQSALTLIQTVRAHPSYIQAASRLATRGPSLRAIADPIVRPVENSPRP